jgi:hypothetical protein
MDATQREIRQGQRMAAAAQPLQPAENHPGPGRGHTKKPHEKAKAGNRSAYLVSRIARDRPDILERMKAGEFSSVREAAREAGIIKDVSLVNQIVRLWEKATPEERQAIRQRLTIDADK